MSIFLQKSTLGFLYTLCLANGIHSDYHCLSNVVNAFNGDVRRCMFHLQFWCKSGGGRQDQIKDCPIVFHSTSDNSSNSVQSQRNQQTQTVEISDNASSSLKLKKSRKRSRMIIDDDVDDTNLSKGLQKNVINDKVDDGVAAIMNVTGKMDKDNDKPVGKRCRLSRRSTLIEKSSCYDTSKTPQTKLKDEPLMPSRSLLHFGSDAFLISGNIRGASADSLLTLFKVILFYQFSHIVI